MKLALVLGMSVFGAACDDGDGGGGDAGAGQGGQGGGNGGCGLAGRTGESSCSFGNSTCPAGQYCDNDAFCEPGCTSDLNCAANEFCEKEAGEALGVCTRCMAMTGEGGAGGGGNNGGCAGLASAGVTCMFFPANQEAAIATACTQVIAMGGEDAMGAQLAITCVEAAGGDCAQIQTCLGGGFGPGGEGGAGGGGDGTCQDDDECNTTPGLTHEICSGGFCRNGCREDDDCGNDFVCDVDFDNNCTPDDF